MLQIIAALLVTIAPTDLRVPWVIDSDGVVHVACADYGPTICYDGTVFSDEDMDGPRVDYRAPSNVPVTPCDTDADCAARNPHVTGYGN